MQIRLRQLRGAMAEAPVYPSEPPQQLPRPSLQRWNQHRKIPCVSSALTPQQLPLVLLPQCRAQRGTGRGGSGCHQCQGPTLMVW